MGLTYVIEHMEEDEATPDTLPPWVELEYTHMKMLAGPSTRVLFTHLSQRSCASLQGKLAALSGPVASSQVYTQSILELLKNQNIPFSKVCLLDPKAERKLEPEDSLEFEWFLFGGILGDDPPRDRTSQLRQLGFPARHLGPVQMTTDTALGVTKRVVDDKTPLDDIPYVVRLQSNNENRSHTGLLVLMSCHSLQEFPTIRFNAKESVEMPFKYIADQPGGEPLLPPGMRELLYEDLNKSFDF